MHALSDLKTAQTKTAQRVLDSLRPLRETFTYKALRTRVEQLLAVPAVARCIDPHAVLSERATTRMAIGVAIASALIALATGTQFDGVLDVHVRTRIGAMGLLADLGISWMLTAAVLWAAARMADRSPEPELDADIDDSQAPRPTLREFVISVGVARAPMLGIALVLSILPPPQLWFESAVRGLLVLPLFAWCAVLLWTGFSSRTGLRGQAALVPFLAGLVIAEAIAKALMGTM